MKYHLVVTKFVENYGPVAENEAASGYSLYTEHIKTHSCQILKVLLQQQQNLGRRFGTSKMHLSPPVA